MKNLSMDIETFSSIDLGKSGVYRYAESPDFEILLFAYSVDDGPVQVIDIAKGEKLPDEIVKAIIDPSVTKWAFNAQFERVCLSRHFGVQLPPESWRCTMVWSATLGLPLSLEAVGKVLGLEKQKMSEGKALIRYFCIPCKPTKANAGRWRNLPEDAPEKWGLFKEYNKRDVETECAIKSRIARFPVPENEWQNYILDQQINDRGILADLDLVSKAVKCDKAFGKRASQRAYELSGLDNPNSVAQVKGWLFDHGLEVGSLNKKTVESLLYETDGEVLEMLKFRLATAKTSLKKYESIERSVCSDGRVRGLFQFYGANRTGRFSGRLVQLQNLPQNHLPDLDLARNLIKQERYEDTELLFDSVPGVLSELIRTAFIPKSGCKFMVADFSAIEARVLSWLAKEKWRMDVFATHGKIYEASASAMFHVPIDEITKGSALRQKGKIAELACIAEGSLVFTDKGLVPIEEITLEHKLWDGYEWVAHDGVICRGQRSVIEYEKLAATPDHYVWVEGKSKPIQFGIAASRKLRLLQTGDGGRAIRLGQNYRSGETLEREKESLLCIDAMPGVRSYPMVESEQLNQRKIQRVSKLFTAEENSTVAGQKANGSKATVRESNSLQLCKLRCKRDRVPIHLRTVSGSVDFEERAGCKLQPGIRPHRYKWALRTGKYQVCFKSVQSGKSEDISDTVFQTGRMAVCKKRCYQKTLPGSNARGDYQGCGNGCIREKKKLESHRSTTRVYDIRNAGPRHRFTVSGILVHNCGYGGAVGALKSMGALEMGVPENELDGLIRDWRIANPNIVQLWRNVDKAVSTTVREHSANEVNGIRFSYQSGILFVMLPSGRKLAYVKPRIEMNRFGRDSVTYEGIGTTKKWERIETYGAKIVENLVQAIARDLLTDAMRRVAKKGYEIVMTVHDEMVVEAPIDANLDDLCSIMGETPSWADGLPLRADGYECDFYKKD